MSQDLRQRNLSMLQRASVVSSSNFSHGEVDVTLTGLSATSLTKASPTLQGRTLKLHVPLFYTLAPVWLKQCLSSDWCLSSLRPKWTERYLVLIGNYLYRYESEYAAAPKGAPIALTGIDARLVNQAQMVVDGIDLALDKLPPGCEAIIAVLTFRKTQYFALSSNEEARTWVNVLRDARQEAITRDMGHAKRVPYPREWAHFDRLSERLVQSKERIQKKMEEGNVRELEMTGGLMG